jgi:sigma-B regulation protein RsbU (phosphoserine phosphatase)
MNFRKKLFLLLVGLAIAPLLALRAFGIHNVHLFADEITRQVHLNDQKTSELQFNAILQRHRQAVSQTFEKLETALLFQTYEARRLLREASGCRRYGKDTNSPTRYDLAKANAAAGSPGARHHIYTGRDRAKGQDARHVEALGGLLPVYQTIGDHLGAVVRRHYTMIDQWVSVFPCHTDQCAAAQGVYGDWYAAAFGERMSYWSRPYIDPDSGRPAIALSLPLYCQEEEIFGLTSLIIDLDRLLDMSMNLPLAERGPFAFIGTLKEDPQSGETTIQAYARTAGATETDPPLDVIKAGDLDLRGDSEPFKAIINDFLRLRSNIHQVRLNGRACYWAFSPISHLGVGLVLVVPVQEKTEVAGLLDAIRERTRRVEILTAAFLVVLVFAATVSAVTFSKIVTKPLEKLTRAAQKLASGNLDAHVAVTSRDEIGELARVFNQIGPQLSQAYAMKRSVELASEIQAHLLPHPPRIDGFDIFGLTLYSHYAGGDYYDFLCDEADRGRLCVAIGDVSGHGIASALLMASVRSALRMRTRMSGTLSDIAENTNAIFSEDVEVSGNFVTLFLARLDRDKRRIRWVRAGHDPALLYDPQTDTFTTLMGEGKGLPLGIHKTETYQEESHPFEPGQIFFLGTDGIWEARDTTGVFFGKRRIKEILRANAGGDAKMIATAVMDAVEAFQAGSDRSDDFTCVVVKFDA